ncbi:MAG: hypothetical protein AAF221_04215 [Pseudomonadota bacterium]
MVNILKKLAILLSVLSLPLNAAMFALWWSMIQVNVELPASERGYTLEALALNITLLEMILVLLGFIFAALGIFGYVEIKSAAEIAAKETAESVAKTTYDAQMRLYRKEMTEASKDYLKENPGDYSDSESGTADSTKAPDQE